MSKEISRCVVVGAAGRMGQRLCKLILDSSDLILAGATESYQKNCIGQTLRDSIGLPDDSFKITEKLDDMETPFDVIIDFTLPEVSMKTVEFASTEKKHAVIGTTGFSTVQMERIKDLSDGFPCVWAPNMSVGVNTLFKLVADAAQILNKGFDVEVLEIHHRYKKDAPSGTALKIAEILADSYNRDLSKVGVYSRKGFTGERKEDEIGIQTLRAGDVVGEHTVIFGSLGERVEIIHRAHNRDCFAQGALQAARWLKGKPNGLYDMQDVLGLKNRNL